MFSSDDGEDDLHDLRERAAIVFVIVSEKPADHFRSTQAGISTAWGEGGRANLARTVWGLRQTGSPKSKPVWQGREI